LVTLGIPGLALLVLGLIAFGIQRVTGQARSTRRFVLGAVAWLAFSAGLALSGFLARVDLAPLPMLPIFLPTLGLPLALALSPLGKTLAERTPLAWLVGFHAFRLPLELVMHQAALEGVMPAQMSFGGANFDIVSGISALLLGLWLARGSVPHSLLLAFNLLGSLLLATIIGVAVASLPLWHAFGREPERLNTWVSYFPFTWLPAALVSAALFGHVLLWRRLLPAPAPARDALSA
jgi:hypothetical protein